MLKNRLPTSNIYLEKINGETQSRNQSKSSVKRRSEPAVSQGEILPTSRSSCRVKSTSTLTRPDVNKFSTTSSMDNWADVYRSAQSRVKKLHSTTLAVICRTDEYVTNIIKSPDVCIPVVSQSPTNSAQNGSIRDRDGYPCNTILSPHTQAVIISRASEQRKTEKPVIKKATVPRTRSLPLNAPTPPPTFGKLKRRPLPLSPDLIQMPRI